MLQFMKAMGVDSLVTEYMPKPGSGKGIFSINYVQSISMMLYGGGESIEDVREIRGDKTLREAIGLTQVPSASATGQANGSKRRHNRAGEGQPRGNRKLLKRDKRKGYTLIIEAQPLFSPAKISIKCLKERCSKTNCLFLGLYKVF